MEGTGPFALPIFVKNVWQIFYAPIIKEPQKGFQKGLQKRITAEDGEYLADSLIQIAGPKEHTAK